MYHTFGILSSLYWCVLNLTQGNLIFDMPPAIKNQLIHLIVESLFVCLVCISLSVCVCFCFFSVCLYSMCSCFNVYLCVSLCLCRFLCVCLSPSSLLSSKACHLVVDWAAKAKAKVFFPILRKTCYATTCLLMNLGLFLYLAICGRASNLERFSN